MNIVVCRGPICTAKGGGAAIIGMLPDKEHKVSTSACMHRCAQGPNVKVDGVKQSIEPTESGCRDLLEQFCLVG